MQAWAIAGSEYPELKRVIEYYQVGEVFDPMSVESIRATLVRMVNDREKTEAYRQKYVEGCCGIELGA